MDLMGIETIFVTYQNYTPVANGITHKSGLTNQLLIRLANNWISATKMGQDVKYEPTTMGISSTKIWI